VVEKFDAEGFAKDPNEVYVPPSKEERKAAQERQTAWIAICANDGFPDYKSKHEKKLEVEIRKHGIPPMFRGEVWQHLAGSHKKFCQERIIKESADAWTKCYATRSTLKNEIQIRKDITRTFPTHENYRRKAVKAKREEKKEEKQVAVEKEEVDEMVAPLLPAVALAGVDLNQLNTNHLNDMKELYTILDVTNLAVKTKLKTHIKRVQKDFAQWLEVPLPEKTLSLVQPMLDKIKEAKVDLNEVNLDDDEEVQQLMQLTGVSTLGAKTQLFKYIRHSRHAAANTNSQQQNSVDLKDQNQLATQPLDEFLSGDSFGDGQIRLFHVLRCYAIHNKSLGYTQGMGGLAGVFLMYMEEEDSFWMMHAVLTSPKYGHLSQLFIDGFPLLHRFQYVMHRLIKDLFPGLHKFFTRVSKENLCAEDDNAMSMILTTFLPSWFNNMFGRFHPPIVMRMWDIFLLEGPKILIRLALGMLRQFKHRMKTMPFDVLLVFLQVKIYDEKIDVDSFYEMLHDKINFSSATMTKYSEQYKKLSLGRLSVSF